MYDFGEFFVTQSTAEGFSDCVQNFEFSSRKRFSLPPYPTLCCCLGLWDFSSDFNVLPLGAVMKGKVLPRLVVHGTKVGIN